MAKLATLGPVDPFTAHAAALYKTSHPEIETLQYCTSVRNVFRAVGDSCESGIAPLENMIDGHVVPVLELLLQSNYTIIDECIISAAYGCVARCDKRGAIRTLYTPWNSRGECSEFIASLQSVTLCGVSDGDEALSRMSINDPSAAALLPFWMLPENEYPLVLPNVNDYTAATTRYIIFAEQEQPYSAGQTYKTSIVVLEADDRPGVLTEILGAFSSRSINLTSVISRPTREHFGMYHFFIDLTGYALAPEMQDALAAVRKLGHIKLLGTYPQAQRPEPDFEPLPRDAIAALQTNPLRRRGRAPRIAVSAGHGPYRNTLDALSAFNLSPVSGRRVLLKPNIGRIADDRSGIVTNPQVVAAAIDVFKAAGALEVAVGESPITGVTMEQAFETSGIAAVARERDCRCIDMDRRDPVELAVADGAAITKLKVCADVFDFDIVVSIPVMKTHMHTVVTLSVKNMKGCLWRRSKVDLHMLPRLPFSNDKSLNIAIADMASVLKPHLVIIDGTVGMEGLGPSAGDPKPLDLVIAGDDALAADSVACSLMGIDPLSVPHLRIAAERGYGSLDTGTFTITTPEWETLRQPFAPVPTTLTMQFPRVTILDEQSCSACQSTVLLFMKRFGEQLGEYFPGNKPVNIAIGKGHKGVPPNTICVGNCTRRFRDAGVYVPGCPPVASSILGTLEKRKKK
ncbi:MAG: DUF362 domain-containing protein [Chitinispirillaceae bacterium]|nr:DUF362 domain-containing protein [Chitinispirillaceae bacterium]